MTTFQLIFYFCLVVFLFVTFYTGRKGTSLSDYYNMGGNASAWLVAGTYTATWISAHGMVGLTGASYASGPLVGILNWGAFTGFIVTAYLGTKLRKFGQVTLGDFFGDRYESNGIRIFSTIITIIALGAYFMSQVIGSAAISEAVLGISYDYMVICMSMVFIVIALVGGAKSVTITDTIMLVIIAVCLAYIFSPLIIAKVGLQKIAEHAAQKPAYYTPTGGVAAWGSLIGFQVLWAFGNAANPAALTRCYLAKDSRTWVQAMMIAFMATMSIVWLTHTAASAVRIENPSLSGNHALTWAAMNMVSPVIGGFAIAGLFGACLSTASTQILTLSFSITRDIYQKIINKDAPEKTVLLLARAWIVIFGIVGIFIGIGRSDMIVAIGNFGGALFAAAYFPALFFGLTWRNFTKEAAWVTMAVGTALTLGLYLIAPFKGLPFGTATHLPYQIHPVLISTVVTLIVGVIVARMTKITPGQVAVYELCNPPKSADPEEGFRTPKARMKKFTIALSGYAIIQLIVVCIYARIVS